MCNIDSNTSFAVASYHGAPTRGKAGSEGSRQSSINTGDGSAAILARVGENTMVRRITLGQRRQREFAAS